MKVSRTSPYPTWRTENKGTVACIYAEPLLTAERSGKDISKTNMAPAVRQLTLSFSKARIQCYWKITWEKAQAGYRVTVATSAL